MTTEPIKDLSVLAKNIQSFSDVNAESVIKYKKMKLLMDYIELKDKHPTLTQDDICKRLNISRTTFFRIRNDLDCPSLYRYKKAVDSRSKITRIAESVSEEEAIVLVTELIKKYPDLDFT